MSIIKNVFDAFNMVEADLVLFVDSSGVELEDENLRDDMPVLDVRNIGAGVFEITVDTGRA